MRTEVSESHATGDRILAQFSNLLAAELLENAYEVTLNSTNPQSTDAMCSNFDPTP